MTSPRKFYLWAALAALIPLLVTPMVAYVQVFRVGDDPQHALFKFHLKRLSSTNKYQTVFLGDSSLGNSIDEELFTRLSGRPTINLALTGLYGYGGSLNMLRRMIGVHPITNVVVMNTVEMMQRPLEVDGYLRTLPSENFSDVLRDHRLLGNTMATFWNLDVYTRLYKGLRKGKSKKSRQPVGNYVEQGPALAPRRIIPFKPITTPDKTTFLTALKALCDQHGINLVYLHGPIVQDHQASKSYLDLANKELTSTGINLVTNLVFLPWNEVGDSIDHVRPEFKTKYTKLYFELVKPHLK